MRDIQQIMRVSSQAMYMRAATMLPLKTHPVVGNTKDTNIECFTELLDSMVEPDCNGWVLQHSFVAAGTALRVVSADKTR